jgi:hypothetical protein
MMDRTFEMTSTAAHQTGDQHETHDEIESQTRCQSHCEKEAGREGRKHEVRQNDEESAGQKESRKENDEGCVRRLAESQREEETGAQGREALGPASTRNIKRGSPDEAGRVLILGN